MGALALLTPGEIFARDFRVLRPLAEGGMGAVYRVEQISTGRERALKIMHPQFARDAETRERFTLEARVGARLQSEHIVEVVSAGVDDPSGMPWMVMELLHGVELNEVVRAHGHLTASETLEIFRQLAHGLGEAHRCGLVHRDIKPENIFVSSSNRSGASALVKILDFGVAKLVQEGSAGHGGTRAVGTPKWMAPEQSETGGAIGASTDVWPLGLLAFFMLTGKLYWRAASDANTSLTVLMREMLLEPIVPASERARDFEVAPLLPGGFDAWFARCTVRDVSARFADASAAFAALEPILVASGAQPGTAALSRIALELRNAEGASGGRSPTGPARTPPPVGASDSGDGATIYPALGTPRPAAPPPAAAAALPAPPPPAVAPSPATASAPTPSAGRSRLPAIGIAVLIVVALGGAYALRPQSEPVHAVQSDPAPRPVAVAPPRPVPAPFLLTIDSEPPSAEVFEGSSRLGTTPMEMSIDAASVTSGPRTLVVKLAGYVPFTLSQGISSEAVHRTVTLIPAKGAPSVEILSTAAAPATHPGHKPKPVPVETPAAPTPTPAEPQPQIRMTR